MGPVFNLFVSIPFIIYHNGRYLTAKAMRTSHGALQLSLFSFYPHPTPPFVKPTKENKCSRVLLGKPCWRSFFTALIELYRFTRQAEFKVFFFISFIRIRWMRVLFTDALKTSRCCFFCMLMCFCMLVCFVTLHVICVCVHVQWQNGPWAVSMAKVCICLLDFIRYFQCAK